MATTTTNLGLTKPDYTDAADIAVINTNMDTVDTAITATKSDLGIVEDGNKATHSITAGQYVIWKGNLYTASSAIATGTTLSTSNLTAVSNGGLNSLNEQIGKLRCGRKAYTQSAPQVAVGVAFPKAFSSTPTVVITVYNTVGAPVQSWLYAVSTTGFHVDCFYSNWQSTFDGEVHWMAFE